MHSLSNYVFRIRIVAITALVVALPALADTPVGTAEQALLAAESQRFADQMAHDAPALAREIAEEATYAHVSGVHQSKAEYLHAIESGGLPYRTIEATERSARIIGTIGVTRGVLHMVVGDSEKLSTYLGVYVRREGRWQLLEWQSAQDPAHPEQGEPKPAAH
jgi:hypothetical protein